MIGLTIKNPGFLGSLLLRIFAGKIDNTFDIGTGFNSSVRSIIQDANGKYLVGGGFTTYQGSTANRIIRVISVVEEEN